MEKNYVLNQNVYILHLIEHIEINTQDKLKKIGQIKGLKKLKDNFRLYLIELSNHNRIWVTASEIQKFQKND